VAHIKRPRRRTYVVGTLVATNASQANANFIATWNLSMDYVEMRSVAGAALEWVLALVAVIFASSFRPSAGVHYAFRAPSNLQRLWQC